jgi:hypothetical protein
MAKSIGQRVKILAGMREFIGKTGEVIDNSDRDGGKPMYRVRLDQPVEVPGVGRVTNDLWGGSALRNLRPPPGCARCGIAFRPNPDHNCESCGRCI